MKQTLVLLALFGAGFAAGRATSCAPRADATTNPPAPPADPRALAERLADHGRRLEDRIRRAAARAREAEVALSLLEARGAEEDDLERLRWRRQDALELRRTLEERRKSLADLERRVRAAADDDAGDVELPAELVRAARRRILRAR